MWKRLPTAIVCANGCVRACMWLFVSVRVRVCVHVRHYDSNEIRYFDVVWDALADIKWI